jgi:3',5'-cyclic AMP phosphodiesterase CpdA
METVRLVVVSDTHLSPRAPEARRHWDAVVTELGRHPPDLVVHAGDLTLDGISHPDELDAARADLDRLDVEWRAVAGNHDVGDWTASAGGHAPPLSAVSQARWRAAIGEGHWRVDVGAWTVLGLDAQLLGSGLDEEVEQWRWLGAALASAEAFVAVVLHKPLVGPPGELGAGTGHRFVPAPARAELLALLAEVDTRVVVSGHVHQYRRLVHDGRLQLWAPTTWALIPDGTQPVFGTKRAGILDVRLAPDGGVTGAFAEVPGVAQLVLGRDLPVPYS